MITAVCANPCLDKTITVNDLRVGQLNRVVDTRLDASGKGLNVAIVLKRLGVPSLCVGFNYTENGHLLTNRLDADEVPYEFIYAPGEIRTNIKVIDISNGEMTELNENGTLTNEENKQALLELVKSKAPISDMMVFTGSLPPGCGDDYYKTLIEACGSTKTVLDTSGMSFELGLQAAPFLIKPNAYELELYLGRKLQSRRDILDAALELISRGVSIVAISLGGDGALITNGTEAYFAPPIPVLVRSTVGAGDSMVSGFCKGIVEGASLKELFTMGVASATASVMTEGTELIRENDYYNLLPRVVIEKLEV